MLSNVDGKGLQLKIADFGLSDLQILPSNLSSTFCGSPLYAAPELMTTGAAPDGYDASKMVVGGFSAGGYIAGYLGATSGKNLLQPGPVNDPATAVHGVMMASAISDMALFDPNDPNVQQMRNTWGTLYWALTYYMGVFADSPGIPRKRQKEASALHNIDSSPGNPAKKIIWAISHGDKDTTVPYAQATALRDRLLSVGAQVRLNTFKNEGHNLVTINLKHLDLLVKLVKASP